MKLDWSNVDWSALLKSQVVVGSFVTIITGVASVAGHALPIDQQTQLTEGITQIAGGLSVLAGLYTMFHRVTAQPEGQTVIVPKKDPLVLPPQTPPQA